MCCGGVELVFFFLGSDSVFARAVAKILRLQKKAADLLDRQVCSSGAGSSFDFSRWGIYG